MNLKKINIENKKIRDFNNDIPKVIAIESVYSMDGDIAPIAEISEIAKENKLFVIEDNAQALGSKVKLSNSENTIERRPPILGEHTEEILKDLGFTNEEIKEFKEKRII